MKSKTTSPVLLRKNVSAFTLIELLVVISIIAILAGLAFGAFSGIQKKGKKVQARNDLNALIIAIKAYNTEYGKYPVPSGQQGRGDIELESNESLMGPLTDPDHRLNPRGHVFFEGNPAKDNGRGPRSGVDIQGAKVLGLYDPWGELYQVVIDADYDKKIDNPDPDAESSELLGGVIGYSKGEDRDRPGESGGRPPFKDNVASWE